MNNKSKAQSLNRKSYQKFTLSCFSVTWFKHVVLLWPIKALDRKQVRSYLLKSNKHSAFSTKFAIQWAKTTGIAIFLLINGIFIFGSFNLSGPSDTYMSCIMTSSNGNIFRVTGPWWWESTGHRWITLTKASDAELWRFLWSGPEQTV